jgi:hypothetical protein
MTFSGRRERSISVFFTDKPFAIGGQSYNLQSSDIWQRNGEILNGISVAALIVGIALVKFLWRIEAILVEIGWLRFK